MTYRRVHPVSTMADTDMLFQPQPQSDDAAIAVTAAIRCVKAFTSRFNARDLPGMDELLHFPHIIMAGERLVIWPGPGQLPPSFFDDLEADTGWAMTTYRRKHIVLASPRKVHLLLDYTRDRGDGSVASRHRDLWIVTFDDDRWGIRQRSY